MTIRPAGLSVAARSGLVLFCLLAAIGSIWAVSVPLFGSPDEQAHVVRAVSIWEGSIDKGRVRVDGAAVAVSARAPEIYAHAPEQLTCWIFRSGEVPSCAPPFRGGSEVVDVETSAGLHPHLFYALVGWIGALRPSASGVYLMRIMGALMCAALIAPAAATMVRRGVGRLGVTAAIVGVTPVAGFLFGTVNPNGFEIAAAIGMWVHGWALTSMSPEERAPLWMLIAFGSSGALLALTRPLSPLFAVVIGVSVLGVNRVNPVRLLRTRRGWAMSGPVLAAIALAASWAIYSGHLLIQLRSPPPEGSTALQATTGAVGGYFQQMVSAFSWLDAGLPTIPLYAWIIAISVLFVPAFVSGRRGEMRWAVGVFALGAVLPVIAQYSAYETNGLVWQGRYGLPLLAGAPILAAVSILHGNGVNEPERNRIADLGLAAMGVGHVVGYYWAMRRWTVGLGGPTNFLGHERWKPPVPFPTWLLLGGFAASVVVGVWGLRASTGGPVDTDSENLTEQLQGLSPG